MGAVNSPIYCAFADVLAYPTVRGRFNAANGEACALQTFATDPIGVFSLTLTNLIVGSAIQIQDQATGLTTLYNGTAAATTAVITLSAYAPGSPLNDLDIRVRKGSAAPKYKPFQTQATAVVGAQSVFVAQIPDNIA